MQVRVQFVEQKMNEIHPSYTLHRLVHVRQILQAHLGVSPTEGSVIELDPRFGVDRNVPGF